MIQFFNKKMSKKRKGFTLIELVVVVAILGILAAIAIPRFTNVSRSAEQSAVEANLRTIESAISLYTAQNGSDAIPTAENAGNLVPQFIAEWPTGPVDTVTYSIVEETIATGSSGYRAAVTGTVAGSTFTNATLEDLGW